MEQLKVCCLLDNFLWGVWAIMMLKDEDVTNEDTFNIKFAPCRAKMQKAIKKEFGIGNPKKY